MRAASAAAEVKRYEREAKSKAEAIRQEEHHERQQVLRVQQEAAYVFPPPPPAAPLCRFHSRSTRNLPSPAIARL